jgi:adenylyltransferase/sulfurtransferase
VCGDGAEATQPLGWATEREDACAATVREAAARPEVSVVELAGMLSERAAGRAEFVLLDVREPGERDVAEIPGSVLLPVGEVRSGAVVPGAGRVVVHCKSGARSAEAVDLLRARGVDAWDVPGGILAWSREVDPSVPEY